MSMVYQRIEQRDGYQLITSVSDKGNYLQYCAWPDGATTNTLMDNIFRMGWASVDEFLNKRRGFKEAE